MDMNLSGLLGQRYIYFKTLNPNNPVFKEIYQDAINRLSNVQGMIGGNLNNEQQQSNNEEQFRFNLESYLSMLQSMSMQLQRNERAFISSQEDLLRKAGISEETISTFQKLGSGEITEKEYQSIINLINIIRYGGDIKTLKTIIKEQKNNIDHIEANIKKMESEQGGTTNKTVELQELQKKYVENYGRYKRDFASKLMRAVREQGKFHMATLMDRYTNKLNSILNAIGNNEEFIQLIHDVIKDQPEDKRIVITEHNIFNHIFNMAVEEADKEENKSKQGRTIAKKIMSNVSSDLTNGSVSEEIKSEYTNVIKGNKRQISIEEIAVTNKGKLSDALREASNAIEIIKKFSKGDDRKNNLENWQAYKNALEHGDEEAQKIASRKFNKRFKASVLNSKTAKQMQKALGTLSTKEQRIIINQLADNLDLAFAKPAPRIDYSLNGLCSLTISKSSLAEIMATKHNEIVQIITNQLPGASINLKNDVFYTFKVNNSFAETIAQARMNQVVTDVTAQIDNIIDNAFGSFMQRYHDMTGGETDVEAANIAYIDSMKKMVKQIKDLMHSLEMTNKEQEEAWEKLSNTFISSISVKEYTLYNNDLGYHGGSLGSGGTPEGVVKNINRMYELGGITPIEAEAILFAILNCAPSAIGSGLKENLEAYLLGGAALMMFDEGFTASTKYLEKMKQEIGINSLPTNLNLYFLNGIYIPASYVIYNIYNNLSLFYGRLTKDMEDIKQRNRVVITNNASLQTIAKSDKLTLAERFQETAAAAMNQITIQFLFMAGMLDILNNLGNAFQIK